MSEIRVKDGESLESALRRFKRSTARSGVLAEVRKREAYEKPSVRTGSLRTGVYAGITGGRVARPRFYYIHWLKNAGFSGAGCPAAAARARGRQSEKGAPP